jgi:hypothetical protein
VLTPELEARILEATRHPPSSSTHWTTRKLAVQLQVSHMMVARVWRKHGLKPHRIERYMAAAVAASRGLQGGGLFQIVSASQASTANISITGHFTQSAEPVWVIDSKTPVDGSGNSLAGESEASLDNFFSANDTTIFAANRNDPLIVIPNTTIPSYINSVDSAVGAVPSAIFSGANKVPVGTIVEFVFPDHTKALYKLQPNGAWLPTGAAWDSQGNAILKNGGPVPNQNTSGLGNGSISVPGFGQGARFSFGASFIGECTVSFTTIEVIDGDGSLLSSITNVAPC